MDVARKLVVVGLLLLATLVTGFWQGSAAKPQISGHKLLALAWVIFTVILVFHSARQVESRTAFFAAVAVLGVSIIALFVTGSLLTIPQRASSASLIVHRVASALAVIASAIMAKLVLLKKP